MTSFFDSINPITWFNKPTPDHSANSRTFSVSSWAITAGMLFSLFDNIINGNSDFNSKAGASILGLLFGGLIAHKFLPTSEKPKLQDTSHNSASSPNQTVNSNSNELTEITDSINNNIDTLSKAINTLDAEKMKQLLQTILSDSDTKSETSPVKARLETLNQVLTKQISVAEDKPQDIITWWSNSNESLAKQVNSASEKKSEPSEEHTQSPNM